MTLHFPDIFSRFCCTGSSCSDNCCRMGWDIEIDQDTLNFYKELNTPLGKKLCEHIYEEDGSHYMSQPDGCPFLNEQGLCCVQLECGEEHISDICREHPRFYEWFGDYKEAGVGLSCEETARLFTVHEKPMLFTEKEIDEQPDDLGFDGQMLSSVKMLRSRLIDIMQDRGFSVLHRLAILLYSAEDIQEAVFGADHDRMLQLSGMLAIDGFRIEIINEGEDEYYEHEKSAYQKLIGIFGRMEYMGDELKKCFEITDEELDAIIENERRFDRLYADSAFELEHVGVYFLYRYLIKAVRDDAVTERVYMAIFCTLAVRLLFMREFTLGAKLPDKERRAFLMKEFSKEIEYDADNMDIIYEEIQEGTVSFTMLGGMLFEEA